MLDKADLVSPRGRKTKTRRKKGRRKRERYRERYTHINLQWQNYHEYLLLVAGQDVLDEGPARPDQHNCEEQQASLASGLPFNHLHFITVNIRNITQRFVY